MTFCSCCGKQHISLAGKAPEQFRLCQAEKQRSDQWCNNCYRRYKNYVQGSTTATSNASPTTTNTFGTPSLQNLDYYSAYDTTFSQLNATQNCEFNHETNSQHSLSSPITIDSESHNCSSPNFFDMITPQRFLLTNISDYPTIDNNLLRNTLLYSVPSSWNKQRSSYYLSKTTFECPVVIYDVNYTVLDKVALYNLLTSQGCTISKDVHQWLREKLAEEINNRIHTEIIKAQISKYSNKNNYAQVSIINQETIKTNNSTSSVDPGSTSNTIPHKKTSRKKSKKKKSKTKEKKSTKGFINCDKAFGLVCGKCDGQFLKRRPFRRAIKNIKEMTAQNQKLTSDRLVIGIQEILKSNGQTLDDIIDYIFEKDPDSLYKRIDSYVSKGHTNYTRLAHHFQTLTSPELQDNLSPEGAVYFTDTRLMSDHLFCEHYQYHALNFIVCTKEKLKEQRDEMNELVQQIFHMSHDNNSLHVDVSCLLHEVVDLIVKLEGKIPEKLELKSFWDGRSTNEVIHAFVILNSILSTQCRYNVFITDMYKGQEIHKNVSKYFDISFSILNDLVEHGFIYTFEENGVKKSVTLPVTVYICADLSALWKLCDETFVCPYCDCTHENYNTIFEYNHSLDFNCRNIILEKYPKLMEHVVIDVLHAKLRIVGNLLAKLMLKLCPDELEAVKDIIRQFPSLSKFEFKEKPFYKQQLAMEANKVYQPPYLNGKQADTLLLNFEKIFLEALNKSSFDSQDVAIWSMFRYIIYGYMEAPSQLLAKQNIEEDLIPTLKKLNEMLRLHYPNENFGYYVHIVLNHLPYLLKKYGTLTRFMNQGCESVHSLGRLINERKSNHKPNGSLPGFAECVLLPLRVLYMSTRRGRDWIGNKQEDKSISKIWQEMLETWKQDIASIDINDEALEKLDKTAEETSLSSTVVKKCVWEKAKKKTNSIKKKIQHCTRIFENGSNAKVSSPPDNSIKACMRCQKQHAKCDHKSPCSNCLKIGAQCVYEPPKKRGRKQKSISAQKTIKTTEQRQTFSRKPYAETYESEIEFCDALDDDFFLIPNDSHVLENDVDMEDVFRMFEDTQAQEEILSDADMEDVFRELVDTSHAQEESFEHGNAEMEEDSDEIVDSSEVDVDGEVEFLSDFEYSE
ncbi:hypothetical protein C9374_007600 [Naegleria lovaniensis]|uniref:Zn(2)-C6 fungal-type domain-containing protein n=1 Tax=Naegleria lovaniensis TaxID=51637 RepID=A0AA88GKB7_NAELO|nr:uncharacterized protein C9374_007600 [Naegleria lovaniensis]KAG2378962.1 hypothetical protein C9374_007600 [Naegleria lovaniensis]